MQADDIRSRYLSFFRERGHAVIPSASLVPENDPTTLFTGSGMQPLLPYLLGAPHPMGTRLVDSQKCFRSGDIEEVGDNRHTTFFEMLGNWSLGDYFKEEQLSWFFEFLTDAVGLDPSRLYVTVFAGDEQLGIPRDEESSALWQRLFQGKGIKADAVHMGSEAEGSKLGMRGGRIFYYDAKKNWWSRTGVPHAMPTGEPGGPDSEVFYDFGPLDEEGRDRHDSARFGAQCHPNCDCGRFLEIGNSVFMQYKKEADGSFSKLPKQNVDFGGGLERLLMAATNTPDIVAVNHQPIIEYLERGTGKRYGDDPEHTRAFRIVADHMKAAVFLIADGVLPSNSDQGYFVRRLLRRAVRFADMLGVAGEGLASVVRPVIAMYAGQYGALVERTEAIEHAIAEEERKFRSTITRGLREFEKLAHGTISGHDAFMLFSTYGFPLEMTVELAAERGLPVDEVAFHVRMKEHQEVSRAGSVQKFKGGLADTTEKTTMLHTCTHLMLAALRKYLGPDVHQAGSNITEERTRFDFTYPEKVPRDILDKVEAYVNEAIGKQCPRELVTMDKAAAKATGVEGSFWDKYPDEVTVYSFAADDGTVYSQELCGGPHVANTGDIAGTFRIIKEEASSAGVRRVKAVLTNDVEPVNKPV